MMDKLKTFYERNSTENEKKSKFKKEEKIKKLKNSNFSVEKYNTNH